MSMISYVVNFDELKDLLNDKLSNITVKDLSNIYGMQKAKGFHKSIPAIKGEQIVCRFRPLETIILTGITYAQSGYKATDSWNFYVDGVKIFDSIHTKELGTQKHWEVIQPVNAETEVIVTINNNSGNSKDVWVDIEYITVTKKSEEA